MIDKLRDAKSEFLRAAYPITYPMRLKKSAKQLAETLNVDAEPIVDAGLQTAHLNALAAEAAFAVVEMPVRVAETFKESFHREYNVFATMEGVLARALQIVYLPLELVNCYERTFRDVYRAPLKRC